MTDLKSFLEFLQKYKRELVRTLFTISTICILLTLGIAGLRYYPYLFTFTELPKTTVTETNISADPINVLFIGSADQITDAFHNAGWIIPDPITTATSIKIATASLAHTSYPTAPMSNLYVFHRAQDLAFEKPTNDAQQRDHIRLWHTDTVQNNQQVWVAQTSFDNGIELSGNDHHATHHISPLVDVQRNRVGKDLFKTKQTTQIIHLPFNHPIFFGKNGGGDYYVSDGDILLINFTNEAIALQDNTIIYKIKNALFECIQWTLGALIKG